MSDLRPAEYPRRQPSFRLSSAQLLMYVGLASLSMLFGATLVAYLITRSQAPAWNNHLPGGVWLSTGVLVLLSLSLRYGERLLARNNKTGLLRGLTGALALSVLFLLTQLQNWRTLTAPTLGEIRSLDVLCFHLLTGLHALHVFAGMAPLVYVQQRAKGDEYSSSRNEGVRLLRQYWDFLLVMWFILLFSLWF